jgi:hypothetical protein
MGGEARKPWKKLHLIIIGVLTILGVSATLITNIKTITSIIPSPSPTSVPPPPSILNTLSLDGKMCGAPVLIPDTFNLQDKNGKVYSDNIELENLKRSWALVGNDWLGNKKDYGFVFDQQVYNNKRDNEQIEIDSTVRMQIHAEPIPNHSNILRDLSGCGAGPDENQQFSPIYLSSDTKDYTAPAKSQKGDFFRIESGNFLNFEYSFICQKPGIYSVSTVTSYIYAGQQGSVTTKVPYTMVCPDTFTLWEIKPQGGYSNSSFQMLKEQDYPSLPALYTQSLKG